VLRGRRAECRVLDGLLAAVREGESRVLVVRGEAGVGKSALLTDMASRAFGCRVARAAGVQSEMELAFAGLHQLCAPMLEHVDGLPAPQRDALRAAFGLATDAPPDRLALDCLSARALSNTTSTRSSTSLASIRGRSSTWLCPATPTWHSATVHAWAELPASGLVALDSPLGIPRMRRVPSQVDCFSHGQLAQNSTRAKSRTWRLPVASGRHGDRERVDERLDGSR